MLTLAPNQLSMLTVVDAFTTVTAAIAVALSTHSEPRGDVLTPGDPTCFGKGGLNYSTAVHYLVMRQVLYNK